MLSTFCHISEYGDSGYSKLPALVAVSGTLNLWAPSSTWLGVSGIQDHEFIQLVEAGYVRVLGREGWLTDPSFRNSLAHNWEPAQWSPRVDGALYSLLRAGCPNVVVAPPERGLARAREIADEDAEAALALLQAYESGDPSLDVPVGVRQSVERAGGSPDAIVTWILRDVVNHADAFSLSDARRPVFLSTNPQSEFLRQVIRILDQAQFEPGASERPAGIVSTRDVDEEQLARQLFELIDSWTHQPSLNIDLLRFMKGKGHRVLSDWYDQLLDDVQEDGCANLDGLVARFLTRNVERHTPGGPKSGRSLRLLSGSAEIAGLTTAVASVAFDPTGVLSIAGLGTAAIDSGLGQLERTGWVKPGYEGTQWPFFYMFGSEATARRHDEALRILRSALPEQRTTR